MIRFAVIAAGEGSRLSAEGSVVPKPMVQLCGTPMIVRLIDIFMNLGADRIAVIVNPDSTSAVDQLKQMTASGYPLDIVVRKTESPMHSLFELAPFLGDGYFCATTVDTVFSEESLAGLISGLGRDGFDGIMGVTTLIDDEKPLFVDVNEQGEIVKFLDEKGDSGYISAGVYALPVIALETLRKCLDGGQKRMRVFQRRLLDDGLRLKAFDMGPVIDVDHVSDIARAEEIISGVI